MTTPLTRFACCALLAVLLPLAPGCASEPHIVDRIIAAHGFDRFDEVQTIAFTFNVERGDSRTARTWHWNTRTDEVTATVTDEQGEQQVTTFMRGDSSVPHDAHFVNDSFWLLLPVHLKWAGEDVTITDHGLTGRQRPGTLMNQAGEAMDAGVDFERRVTVSYASSGGGYTPGDRYELYLDADDRIVRWDFHRGGAAEATMTTTWTDYQRFGPLLLSLERRGAGDFRLFFTDVEVTTR